MLVRVGTFVRRMEFGVLVGCLVMESNLED